MTVRGRANRSGSDPANNPYRPDSSWSSPMGSYNGSQRFNRDSRSLSLDSNMNTKTFPHQQVPTTSSTSLTYPQGYYNNHSYAYGARHGLNNNNNNNNRHSAEFSRSSSQSNYLPTAAAAAAAAASSYDMYATSTSVDMHHPQQQYNHHHHPQHHQHQHHHQHQSNGHHRISQQIGSIYDHGTSPYSSIYSSTGGGGGGGGASSTQAFSSSSYTGGNQQTKATIEPATLSINNDDQQELEVKKEPFSTPQPHYKKPNSPTTETAAAVGDSPSPPHPTMDNVKGRPNQKVRSTLVDNNQYNDWM
jgi:hypothetical protein